MPLRDVEAVSPEEAEKADFVCCMLVDQLGPAPAAFDRSPWAEYTRQVRARSEIQDCAGCGRKILVDVATSPKKPKKVCLECVADIVKQESNPHAPN